MKKLLLLENRFKKIGWFILIPFILLGLILIFTDFEPNKIYTKLNSTFNTVVGSMIIIGGILVGFSKEKTEDEYISNLRLNSLLWAVLINYLLLLIAFIFIYDFAFINVMIYNIFTTLIFFIVRFNTILYINSKRLEGDQ